MWPAVIANVIAGYISGLVHKRFGVKRINMRVAFLTALVAELILKALVIGLSKPFSAAWELEKIIAVPTTIANCLGVCLFVYIVRDIFHEHEMTLARSAHQVMRVMRETSGLLRTGLNEENASKVADIIYSEFRAAAVAVTDTTKVLAFVGLGSDHHVAGGPIITDAANRVIKTGQTVIGNSKEEVGCPHKNCELTAVADTPLIVTKKIKGSIKLFKTNNETISPYEAEVIQGIADFLSFQLTQAALDEKEILLARAEYSLLKAQVNPHFLFNTLGTIRALARTEPETARKLIKDLSDFLRKALNRSEEITVLREELEIVRNYLSIEKARFGNRIQVFELIPEVLLEHPIPVFSLQPLVENAVKHGLSRKKEGGLIRISAWQDNKDYFVEIEDDGVGIAHDKLPGLTKSDHRVSSDEGAGIGIINVHRRMQKISGEQYGLTISSQQGQGTKVIVHLPIKQV
jgi:two-component system sensor histidine kinase LytS